MVPFLHRCLVSLGRNHGIQNSAVHTLFSVQPQTSILCELPLLPLLKSTTIHQWQSQFRRSIPSLCSSMAASLTFRSVSPSVLRSPMGLSFLRSGCTLTVDLQDSLLAASGGRMGGKSSSSSSWSSSHHHYPSSSSKLPSPRIVYVSSGNGGGCGSSPSSSWKRFIGVLIVLGVIFGVVVVRDKTSVIKLQVCLSGDVVRSLQKDLDEIAQVADTSTNQGLNYVLQETILALLRHPECIASAYSSVDVKRSFAKGEKHFNQLSIQEREKFDDETHVNVNNIKKKKDLKLEPEIIESNIQYIVVTILVVVSGEQKLAPITSITDLKKALRNLGSVSSEEIKAVEVLWTPQQESESISEVELLLDYPFLRPLHDYTAEYNRKLE